MFWCFLKEVSYAHLACIYLKFSKNFIIVKYYK